jgi:hypothetical protein
MSAPRVSEADQARIRESYQRLRNTTHAAAETGFDRNTVRRYAGDLLPPPIVKAAPATPHVPEAEPTRTYRESGDSAEVVVPTERVIRTLEDALAHAEVDPLVWRVKSWGCTSWQVGMKLRDFSEGKITGEAPIVKNLWRLEMKLERIQPKPFHDATEAVIARMAEFSPKYPKLRPRRQPDDPHMLEIDLFDVHFGKLCWEPETGNSYDLKIAERVFRNAVEDLVDKAAGYNIDEIVFPFGNDFVHVDTQVSTTTAGTYQDSDGRLAKIIETAKMAAVWAVDYLRQIAPVKVLLVPGNHGRQTELQLAHTLHAWFRLCDDVTVDYSPMLRKYVRYGTNLIGYTHGNLEKHTSLPTIMAGERKADWAETTYHAWRLGHYHTSKVTTTTPLWTQDGVEIRILRSLAGTDSWHFNAGYVGGTRAAEAFLLSHKNGFSGNFVANAREN